MGASDQAYVGVALNSHLGIGVEACAPRAASTPPGVRAERVAGPVLDAGQDDLELEGKDVLDDVGAGGEGLESCE